MTDLITSRLVLHPLTIAEATRIANGAAAPDDVWADGFPGEGDRNAARMALKAAAAETTDQRAAMNLDVHVPFTSYRIDCRADSTAIGTIGFHGPPNLRRQVTIGYGLVPHSWGNGYATEAVRALIELCRAHPDISSLAADTAHGNHASQRVLLKTGFHLVRQDHELLYYERELDSDVPLGNAQLS
jgi:RimJ/RimL family protein N-acetyltransferase